ncbi:hypothetical protein [Halegenticoccus tardaugens]|uniref:hypothetical protein n=1 Tax=Halegenticoccus tardaugens TaxID=2071624 RepID=UPI00100B53AD|nr:hypothetical protein [Halegenticoccus tardaugens]
MGENQSDRRLEAGNLLLAAVLFVGVVGSGLAKWTLTEAGYGTLGSVLFVMGYGGMIAAVWFGWLRHYDFTGPAADR